MSVDGSGTTFWSLGSLRAGLFLIPRLGPIIGLFLLVGYAVASSSRCVGVDRINLGWWATILSLALLVVSSRLQPLARKWAHRRYSSSLERPVRWSIIWRGLIVTLACLDALVLLEGPSPLPRAVLLAVAAVVVVLGWGWALSVASAPSTSRSDRPGGWRGVLRTNVTPPIALAAIAAVVLVTAPMSADLFRTGCGPRFW
jgi:hypothetical protein